MAARVAGERLTPRDVAKFTAIVAFSAIFVDAVLGHGLAWENDPYWTYWITKTFLIATIFGLGTAWVGIGEGRGAAITAVHTIVLTIYYWSLAPVGLPASPDWLDLDHTWLTGLPIHFAVIYLGYLLALWIWRRRVDAKTENDDPEANSAATATAALAVAVAIVVLAGALTSVAIMQFVGATWFVTRLLITFVVVYGWWTLAGRDAVSGAIGGTVLAFVWTAYGHFLSPTGLPHRPLRIFDSAPPPADVHWMSFRDLWLVSLPISIAVMVAVMVAASTDRARWRARPVIAAALPSVVVAAALGASSFVSDIREPGRTATVNASGPATIEFGTGGMTRGSATLDLRAVDIGGRVTPLPPHDRVALTATVQAGRRTYRISSKHAAVEDSLGRHTTWWGVGFDVWHHGRSGIGSAELPAIRSKLALFAVGEARIDGRVVATSAPIHFMTVDNQIRGVGAALQIGDDDTPIDGVPGGTLHANWPSYTGDLASNKSAHSYALGSFALAVFLGAFLIAGRRSTAPVPVAPPAPTPERPLRPPSDARTRKPRAKPKSKSTRRR